MLPTKQISSRIDKYFIEIENDQTKAYELDNHLKKLKLNLKLYYNSALLKKTVNNYVLNSVKHA